MKMKFCGPEYQSLFDLFKVVINSKRVLKTLFKNGFLPTNDVILRNWTPTLKRHPTDVYINTEG